jgi:hypothetical protein
MATTQPNFGQTINNNIMNKSKLNFEVTSNTNNLK